MKIRPARWPLAISLVAALSLTGCAAASPATPSPAPTEDGWPRTVSVGGEVVTLDAPAERIVALSTETGDLALELAGPDRVTAVSTGSVTEGAGNQVEQARRVETVLPPGTNPDPEQILSLNPDLVMMTSRHEGEEDAADVLDAAGVPALIFEGGDFEGIDSVISSIDILGTALGAEKKAAEITEKMAADRERVLDAIGDDPSGTSVMLLMARGGTHLVQSRSSAMSTLATEAGGTVVGASPGARPADAETIVQAAPEVILVEDFRGEGLAPFAGLLEQGALRDVPAIADERVHLVSGAIASGTAGTRVVEGLERIASLLHPDAGL